MNDKLLVTCGKNFESFLESSETIEKMLEKHNLVE